MWSLQYNVCIKIIIVGNFEISYLPVFLIPQMYGARIIESPVHTHSINNRESLAPIFVNFNRRTFHPRAFWPEPFSIPNTSRLEQNLVARLECSSRYFCQTLPGLFW